MMTRIVFECRKCEHRVCLDYKSGDGLWRGFQRLLVMDCPECGEEPERNWMLIAVIPEVPDED